MDNPALHELTHPSYQNAATPDEKSIQLSSTVALTKPPVCHILSIPLKGKLGLSFFKELAFLGLQGNLAVIFTAIFVD